MPSSSEATAIFPRPGDSESNLTDDTDERDDDVAEDDRERVDATDMDVDKDEGKGEGRRCCNALYDAVSRRASSVAIVLTPPCSPVAGLPQAPPYSYPCPYSPPSVPIWPRPRVQREAPDPLLRARISMSVR